MTSQPNTGRDTLDFAAIRKRLAGANGPEFWRGLEEIAETPAFREYLENEFAPGASEWTDPVSRRRLLQLLGASLGLAGLTACTKQPPEKIVPYVKPPEEIVPGKPLYYATALPLGGFAAGVLAESHMGRPTKIEGNPDHPASLGGTGVFEQASILTLYDPERSQTVIRNGRISNWVGFLALVGRERERMLTQRGAGLRILTETVTSPTLAHLLRSLLAEFPEARWHQYEPVNRDPTLAGAQLAFGEPVNTVYRISDANVVLSLGADFLACGPGSLRYAREFAGRRSAGGRAKMNRLYVAETAPSSTGAMADHRLPLSGERIESFARALAATLGVPVRGAGPGAPEGWVRAVAADLQAHRGASLVIAGEQQPPAVHALAHAMNHVLGNQGKTVIYTDPVEAEPVDQAASLRELVADLAGGKVEILLMLGGNPVYNAPADLKFREQFLKAPLRVHLSLFDDETSELCHWHLPETHPLEAWGDVRAYDGTVTVQQPLIEPLYSGHSAIEVLAAWAGQTGKTGYEIVREYWKTRPAGGEGEAAWQKALHDGLMAGTSLPAKPAGLRSDFAAVLPEPEAGNGTEISFLPDPTIWDGRLASNAWLQELPKPITKLTWDNAALLSPATAERLQLSNTDVVELTCRSRTVRAPVWVLPGHADDCVTMHLGYGRTRGAGVGQGKGFNAYALRDSGHPWSDRSVTIQRTGERYPLACTQTQHSMEGRQLVRIATLEEFRQDEHCFHKVAHEPDPKLTMYPDFQYTGYSWGMAIDLNACTGCGACVVACQAENNIAVVGKDQVMRGRAMHWIRVDRYFQGGLENPQIHHQPLPCMHCENAPCETVCPTSATVHSEEGLNQMAYNRCVGTRYCANNCPYKVRRFNFYLFSDWDSPSLKLLRNPDVTVRSRGVMEKCSYCVQRINLARVTAKREDRQIRDGEVITACQGACPTQAIVFGDLNDPESRMAKLRKDPRNYGLLTELGTRPRTTYLGKLRNPNPELEKA